MPNKVVPQVVTPLMVQAMFWPAVIGAIGWVARAGIATYTGYQTYKDISRRK